jgi:double zinc ribbon protein
VTDLERLFRLLVQEMAGSDPARLHRPVTITELSAEFVPYRVFRRTLEIETAEDYDALLLRFLAGEENLVRMTADPVAERFTLEARSANPDLGVLREFGRASFALAPERLARVVSEGIPAPFRRSTIVPGRPSGPAATAPPRPPAAPDVSPPATPAPTPATPPTDELPLDALRRSMPELDQMAARHIPNPPPPKAQIEPSQRSGGSSRCGFCGGALPPGRAVNFCPFCGQNQVLTRCPDCQAEVEIGWRHCVNCGSVVGE